MKSAAYLQSWPTHGPSTIIFRGLSAQTWDPLTGDSGTARTYNADVYVFALLTPKEHAHFNPLNSDQWEFWVAHRAAVESTGSRSLGLAAVKNLAQGPLRFADLRGAVREASARGEPRS